MDDNQRQLRDVLGIYYDSSEAKMNEVPDFMNIKMIGKMLFTDTGATYYDLAITCGTQTLKSRSGNNNYSSDAFPEILNLLCPEFYVNDEISSGTPESFTVTVREVNKPTMTYSEKQMRIASLVKVLSARDLALPLNFSLEIDIKRETSLSHRTAYANKKRTQTLQNYMGRYHGGQNISSINDFFATVCNPDRGTPTYSSYRGNTEFKGVIKKAISNKEKKVAIFLIEYLWGNKIPISSTRMSALWDKLSVLSYNDFGIKDAVKMRDVVGALNGGYDVKQLHASLIKTVPPKTTLKRWQKILNPVSIKKESNNNLNGGTTV